MRVKRERGRAALVELLKLEHRVRVYVCVIFGVSVIREHLRVGTEIPICLRCVTVAVKFGRVFWVPIGT